MGQDSYNSQGSRSTQVLGSRFPPISQATVSLITVNRSRKKSASCALIHHGAVRTKQGLALTSVYTSSERGKSQVLSEKNFSFSTLCNAILSISQLPFSRFILQVLLLMIAFIVSFLEIDLDCL